MTQQRAVRLVIGVAAPLWAGCWVCVFLVTSAFASLLVIVPFAVAMVLLFWVVDGNLPNPRADRRAEEEADLRTALTELHRELRATDDEYAASVRRSLKERHRNGTYGGWW